VLCLFGCGVFVRFLCLLCVCVFVCGVCVCEGVVCL